MSSLFERAKAQVIEAIENIDSLEELESTLNGTGLEIDVTVGNNSLVRSNGRSANGRKAKKGKKAPGVVKMWNAIRKIAKEHGIKCTEAREIYLQEKQANPPKRKVSRAAREEMRRRQIKYWKQIDKIAAENNCSKSQARRLFASQAA